MSDPDLVALEISSIIYHIYEFGPSQSICKPFAEQVIAEAQKVNYEL
jgi:hypothetical protein